MSDIRTRIDNALDRSPVLLGLVAVVVTMLLMLGVLSGKLHDVLSNPDTRTVSAVFGGTQQLRGGDHVRIDGVDVGEVADMKRAADGRSVTVEMDVKRDAGPLYDDARAVLRFRTVLGGSLYVALERGTPGSGELRGPIPVKRTVNQVEVDDLTSVFRGGAVRGLQTMPGELAKALQNPVAPASALGELARQSPALRRGLHAVRGQRLDRDLRELVSSAAATVRAVDSPDDELRRVVAGAAATVTTTANRAQDIRTTIGRAPAVLRRTDDTVTALDHTLTLADPLVATLNRSASDVAPTLHALRPTVVRADALLQRATPLLRALRPAVRSLAGASKGALPLLQALDPSIARVRDTILPYLAEVDPETQHTTSEMIGPTFTGLGSGAGGQMDVNGHFIRFPATSGSSPVYLPCQVYFGNPSADKAIVCKSLQDSLSTYLNYNPLGGTPGSAPARRAGK
jgi:phospholipid/cholesterol/gamma-HCH transport system substrate-binding protein